MGPALFAFEHRVRKIERIKTISKIARAEMLSEKASNESAARRPVLEGLIEKSAAETYRGLLRRERR